MPLYKLVGNKILTRFQNALLGTNLTEFHSGYRLYSRARAAAGALRGNTNDFHFDTEIIIQFVLAGLRIKELPIPTYYGDEVCRVNGMKYAWDVCKTMLRARVHQMDLLYDRKFDVDTPEPFLRTQARLPVLAHVRARRRDGPAARCSTSAAARRTSPPRSPRAAAA